ncbi:MAG: HAD hydrolase-like protein [Nitrospirae bacterium]|nr:HAD hydrolase-like protein [Nitrospirota bacterium]
MKKLVLFDIDGTLISTGGAGVRALERAFHKLFGIADAFNGIAMAGRTDLQIIRDGLGTHGFPNMDGNVEKMKDMYIQYLREEIKTPLKSLKPGIKEILRKLSELNMPVGLLTGNLEDGARIKLGPFGLNEYFVDGAFGSDHEDRDYLLPIAVEKFAARGLPFRFEDCIVVGDTPRDVRCAKVHGARCIAVATGPYSREDLLKTDADVVFDSLADRDTCIDFILRGF